MNINDKMLDKIADLARLTIQDHERAGLKKDMNAILDWVEKLNEVDTSSVEPLLHMTEEQNRVRQDENPSNISRDDALKNAPVQINSFFVVPKVIKRGK